MTWGERIHAITAGVRRRLVRDVVAVKRYDQASQVETSIRNLRQKSGGAA